MDIEHLGDAVIEHLVQRGLVQDFADLYALTVPQVARLPAFAAKSARNLVDAIAGSRQRGLARLLTGLGIPLVGPHVGGLRRRGTSSRPPVASGSPRLDEGAFRRLVEA